MCHGRVRAAGGEWAAVPGRHAVVAVAWQGMLRRLVAGQRVERLGIASFRTVYECLKHPTLPVRPRFAEFDSQLSDVAAEADRSIWR